ncbi:MAG: hypothetical protein ACRD26_09980 [Vicinamibacterales bacterium]
MTRVKLIGAACCTAMLTALTLSVAAQDFNTSERTFLTFSGTVELPGVTLQPGTYLFRLADSQSNRHIVQVFSQDEKQIHATILAVPAERLEVTGENVVTFRESAEGATPAVQFWYYPGDRIGHEFVYPKDQATRIAQRTGQNVLSTEGEASAGSTVSSTGPDGRTTEWAREGTPAPAAETQPGAVQGTTGVSEMPRTAPTPEQPEETVARETPPAEPAAPATGSMSQTPTTGTTGQADTRAGELPRTASPLALVGLVGLLSLGGALALRRAGR